MGYQTVFGGSGSLLEQNFDPAKWSRPHSEDDREHGMMIIETEDDLQRIVAAVDADTTEPPGFNIYLELEAELEEEEEW